MKSQTLYAIRLVYTDGSYSDPMPGITSYQHAMRRAKEFAQNENITSAWVVTYKATSVRKVAA
jgi:hypothetical protein